MYRIGISPDLVDRQVRAQRQDRGAGRILIVKIIVVAVVADVDGRVVERLAALGIQIAASARQVDGPKSGAVHTGQVSPFVT